MMLDRRLNVFRSDLADEKLHHEGLRFLADKLEHPKSSGSGGRTDTPRETRIATLEGKMNAAKENREYQTLKEQIAADKQANNVLSDEILELLEQVDVVHAQIEPASERIKAAEAEAAEIEKRVQERMSAVEADLKRVTNELAQVEQQLEGEFKRDYDRLVSLKGEDSIAETEGNCCGGCYQMLTPQLLDRLANHASVVCPTCGRLLYQA